MRWWGGREKHMESSLKRNVMMIGVGILLFALMQMFVVIGMSQLQNGKFLCFSGAWSLLSILLYFAWKDERIGVALIITNVVMAGFTIAAYFKQQNLPGYDVMTMLGLGSVLLLVQGMVMQYANNRYKIYTGMAWLSIFGGLYGIYVMILQNASWGSGIIFLSIFLLSLNISLRYYRKPPRIEHPLHTWKLASMMLFGGVLIAVITIITEGDALEFFASVGDGGSGGVSRRKK